MKATRAYTPLLFLLVTLLAGCARHRWLEVRSGSYSEIRGSGDIARDAARELDGLQVDPEEAVITLRFDDGSELTLPFVAWDRADWPMACPTNLFHHYLEVLDLGEETLEIGPMMVKHPILMRNCPAEPEELVLQEASNFGDGSSRLSEPFLIFAR
jgi:hypothetical protein